MDKEQGLQGGVMHVALLISHSHLEEECGILSPKRGEWGVELAHANLAGKREGKGRERWTLLDTHSAGG